MTLVNFMNIPAELKTACRFCVWKFEKRSGKKTKIPYNPKTGKKQRAMMPGPFLISVQRRRLMPSEDMTALASVLETVLALLILTIASVRMGHSMMWRRR